MANDNAQSNVRSLSDYGKDAADQWQRWNAEFNSADKARQKFVKRANKTVDKYVGTNNDRNMFATNTFHSDINTIKSMMFGRLPEVTFTRTNMDFNDDAARVAGMMLQRMLGADIGTPNDQYSESLKQNLLDRLTAGLGLARVRYEFNEEQEEIAAVYDIRTGIQRANAETVPVITNERAPLDYVHWRDVKWSPCRTWAESRWVAFRTMLTYDQLEKRFGKDIADEINLTEVRNKSNDEDDSEEASDIAKQHRDAFMRGEVWEIWDKVARKVVWWCSSVQKVLDTRDDPLELTGFYPCPEPMAANVTTSAYMPTPDYIYSEDLYLEVDRLETRIAMITEAVKVVGVYDKGSVEIKRMMSEACENDLIPVDNWAAFAEQGGISGAIDWLPIDEISNVLAKLVARRDDVLNRLAQSTGMADIMRGGRQAGGAVTATERALESRYASVRIQALQDEFAKYATDLIRLRAEVISKHFSPETIVKQSNMQFSPDQQLIGPAVELIKTRTDLVWRINVKPESVAMVDYAQLKEERTAYMTALATFMQSSAPIIEKDPRSAPALLEMLKWGLAGFKGSSEIEGVLDQAINQMQAPQEQPQGEQPPSDAQIKAQMEESKQKYEMQKLDKTQAFEREKWQYEAQKAQTEGQMNAQQTQMEAQKDLQKEQAQFQFNMDEERNETIEFIKREQARRKLNPPSSNNLR
jgi:hypothetical protein